MEAYPRLRAELGNPARPIALALGPQKSERDALTLPIAISGRFRALRTLKLLLMRRGAGLGGLAARFGLGERALGGRRQLLAFRDAARRWELSVIAISLIAQGSAYRSTSHSRNCLWRSYIWHIRMPNRLSFQWHEPEPSAFETLPLHATFKDSQYLPKCPVSRRGGSRPSILDGVLHKHRTLDDQLDGAGAHPGLKTLADRDRALMRGWWRRSSAARHARPSAVAPARSRHPTDAPRAQSALLIGAAQILWMDVPDHAAVDLSVRLVQSDRRAAKYAGLVNAVLRRCAREGQPLIDEVKSQTSTFRRGCWRAGSARMARPPRGRWRRHRP